MFNSFWLRLTTATPNLEREDVVMRISVAEFKRQMNKAYDAGYKQSIRDLKAEVEEEKRRFSIDSLFMGFFK